MRKFDKFKKVIAGVLSTTMIMTSMVGMAFAATDADDTINTTKKGSLSIKVYEYNGSETLVAGTGSTSDDSVSGKLPSDIDTDLVIEGAQFKLYKIATIDQTTTSAKTELKYNVVSAFQSATGKTVMTSDDEATVLTALSTADLSAITPTKSGATASTGIVKFENLDLGLYYVVQSSAPAQVTSMVDPFFVSVPTTQADGEKWMYDINVYPKNSTAIGEIELDKVGVVGNGSEAALEAKFFLQKKVDSNWVNQKVTLNTTTDKYELQADNTGATSFVAKNGVAKICDLVVGEYRFVEDSLTTTTPGYIVDSAKTYEFEFTADSKILVNGTEQSKIKVYNYKPTIEKEVKKKGADVWGKNADYSVGDDVDYKIVSTVPANIADLSTYKIVDEMDNGLEVTSSTVYTVTYYAGTTAKTIAGMPSVVTDAGKHGWSLDLSEKVAALDTNDITSIEVRFAAKLTKDAITSAGASTETGNLNTVSLEYTSKIYDLVTTNQNPVKPEDPDPTNPDPTNKTKWQETTKIEDKVTVYTFGIQLTKTFAGATPSATVNATFDLYEADDTSATTIKLKDGTNKKVSKIGTYTTDATGKIVLSTSQSGDNDTAFSNGSYYFVETATYEGYSLLEYPVEVVLNYSYETVFTSKATTTYYYADVDAAGNIDEATIETVAGTPVETSGNTSISTTYKKGADTVTNVTTALTVENHKSVTFPVTGGKGTLMFTLVGLALMIAAVAIFFTARKRKTN